jgi:hypothetical protein
MISNFRVDQAATFAAVAYLSSEPKLKFGSDTDQECTKDGRPKWNVQVIAGFRDLFGKVANEVLKIGVASHREPGEGLAVYTPVVLVDFEVGCMERTKKDQNGQEKVIGAQIWYRCSEIRPVAATSGRSAKSEHAA